MTEMEKELTEALSEALASSENTGGRFIPERHPYTCEITGLETGRPCHECVIYKKLDAGCRIHASLVRRGLARENAGEEEE